MSKWLAILFAIVSIKAIYAAAIPTGVSTIIINNLKISLPELTVTQINPTAVPNIYEIVSGHKVFYVDSSGRYAFLGNMVDLTTKQSLTQTKVEQLSVVDWNQLPLNIAIRQVIGNGKNRIAVFTDPDCAFCQHLEQDTIPKLTNVTIYYFFFPLSIHANAETDSLKILCAENPDATFLAWMKTGTPLPARTTCKNSANLTTMKSLGNKFGIEATPTIILPNGKLLPGLVPPDYLSKLILAGSPESTVIH